MESPMTEPLEEKRLQLQKELKDMDWEELKSMLKLMTEKEKYEVCRLIQNEIDERVKNVKV